MTQDEWQQQKRADLQEKIDCLFEGLNHDKQSLISRVDVIKSLALDIKSGFYMNQNCSDLKAAAKNWEGERSLIDLATYNLLQTIDTPDMY